MVADNMSPCLFTCTRLTNACRTAGLLNRARHWANVLFKNGIVPDGGVQNHTSHGCGSQNGDPQSQTAGTHEFDNIPTDALHARER